MKNIIVRGLISIITLSPVIAQNNSIESYAAQKCDVIGKILVKCMTYENCQNAQNELAIALSGAKGMNLEEKRTLINYCGIECRKIKTVPKSQKTAAMQGEYKAIYKRCYESEINIYKKNPELK